MSGGGPKRIEPFVMPGSILDKTVRELLLTMGESVDEPTLGAAAIFGEDKHAAPLIVVVSVGEGARHVEAIMAQNGLRRG